MEYFKKPRMTEWCLTRRVFNVKKWIKDLGLLGLFTFFILFVFSPRWEITVICIAEYCLLSDLSYFPRNEGTGNILMKLEILVNRVEMMILMAINYFFALELYYNPIILEKGYFQFSAEYILTTLMLLTFLNLILSTMFFFVAAPQFAGGILCYIQWRIRTRFPMSKSLLEKCGVKNQRDCALYYCWAMHNFGKEEKPVLYVSDFSDKTFKEMESVFYSFQEAPDDSEDDWMNFSFREAGNIRAYNRLRKEFGKDNFCDFIRYLNLQYR